MTRGRDVVPTRTRGAPWALGGAAILVIVSGLWLALRVALPGDGAPWRQDPGFTAGVTVDPATAGSGVRAGDVVVAVDGLPLDRWLARDSPRRPRLAAGQNLTYRISRGGIVFDVPVRLSGAEPVWSQVRHQGGVGVAAVALLYIGGFTVRRRPDHLGAQALLLLGAALLTAFVFTSAAPWEVAYLVTSPWLFEFGMAGAFPAFVVMALALAQLSWTFPSAPAILERHRWCIGLSYALVLASTLGVLLVYLLSGRATLDGLQNWYSFTSYVLSGLSALALVGVGRTIMRAARSAQLRAQVRIVGAALGVTVLGLLILNVVAPATPAGPWIVGALFLPLPASIAAALLRGEFLDIRATISRALIYLVTTLLLLGTYVGLTVLVAAALDRSGIAATLPVTAVIAIAFAPVRARVQRAVERLLYGYRGQPARVLAALGARLQVALPPEEILPVVADTIATTLRLPYVALKLIGAGEAIVCERGDPPSRPESVVLVHQGQLVGELVVGPRPGERALAASDRALLTELSPHLAATVRAAALITELTDSRTRLAVAREDERARLRHDLHDRVGSRLVGVSLKLGVVAKHAAGTPLQVPLNDLAGDVDTALEEVRRLARGLRPAELDELGLLAAVEAAAARLTLEDAAVEWRSEVSAAVHLPTLTPDVEAAAYQIALEAMTNSYRHSAGSHAHIRIATDPSGTRLVVEVSDDGHGGADPSHGGVGIRSMNERASAVGGTLQLTTALNGGTLVRAELPLAE